MCGLLARVHSPRGYLNSDPDARLSCTHTKLTVARQRKERRADGAGNRRGAYGDTSSLQPQPLLRRVHIHACLGDDEEKKEKISKHRLFSRLSVTKDRAR